MDRLLLGLVCTPGIGWKTIRKLLDSGIDPSWFNRSVKEWETHFPYLRNTQVLRLKTTLTEERIQTLERELHKLDIHYLTYVDEQYPTLLKEIYDPPWVLFYRGNIRLLNSTPFLSIVGSRKTSVYGRKVTEQFTAQLVGDGWGIVSGMALGIDTVAHQQALQDDGLTVAVLGSGLNVIYPSQNKRLFEQIVSNGLVLSEYPPNTKPHPSFFPQRNRIISGLAYGTLVVEASEQSGSLITANFALEQGREVFAVPGSIFDTHSRGTNQLIQKHGAKLVMHPADIFEELSEVVPQIKKSTRKNGTSRLEDDEQMILNLLQHGKKHINELLRFSSLSTSELSRILMRLQIKGYVSVLPGSYYQIMELQK